MILLIQFAVSSPAIVSQRFLFCYLESVNAAVDGKRDIANVGKDLINGRLFFGLSG